MIRCPTDTFALRWVGQPREAIAFHLAPEEYTMAPRWKGACIYRRRGPDGHSRMTPLAIASAIESWSRFQSAHLGPGPRPSHPPIFQGVFRCACGACRVLSQYDSCVAASSSSHDRPRRRRKRVVASCNINVLMPCWCCSMYSSSSALPFIEKRRTHLAQSLAQR